MPHSIAPKRASALLAAVCSLATASFAFAHAGEGHAQTPRSTAARAFESVPTTFDATPRARAAGAPTMLAGDLLAYAPVKHGSARTVVYLHGVHGKAENGCPWMHAGAADVGWLVCPRGARTDEGPAGTASWGGDVPAQGAVVARALRAAEVEGASAEPGVAVGFSQGAYVALDLVKTNLGHFRGLVLLGAPEAHPSARRLMDLGVARIALGAGSLDPAYPVVKADVARLAAEGIDARFVDLGRVGHTYIAEDPDVLSDAIAWAGSGCENARESC